jgi:hypothetical protein
MALRVGAEDKAVPPPAREGRCAVCEIPDTFLNDVRLLSRKNALALRILESDPGTFSKGPKLFQKVVHRGSRFFCPPPIPVVPV